MHHVVVGLTWLKKRLAALGLKRRNVVETRLTLVHQAIKNELQTSNCCLGYRAMWRLLQLKYRYTIKRSTVMMLLAVMDPIASGLRKVKRLTKRTYVNKASDKPHVCSYLYLELSVSFQGPNWCWHINGYDKLKPGFPIHACIDGFSQKIIWLELTATNNDPDVVVKFYLDAVVKLEAISTLPGIRGSSWTVEVHSMPPTWRRHATLYLHSPAKSTDLNGLMYKCKACFHNVAPFKSQRSEPFLEPSDNHFSAAQQTSSQDDNSQSATTVQQPVGQSTIADELLDDDDEQPTDNDVQDEDGPAPVPDPRRYPTRDRRIPERYGPYLQH
eukprot:Em0005g26a